MKDNKFLTGFLIVTLLGAGALGFLLFQARGKYTEASTAYAEKIGELQSLQGGKPFPNEANYKKVLDLQKTHQQAINDLQKQLAAAEIPVEPTSPEKFQDELREAIKNVRALAAQKGTEIEGVEKFSLGFEIYQSQPPKPEAAAPLGRMLKAIVAVVTELLNTAPSKMADIKRTPLAEEGIGPAKVQATPPPRSGGAAKKTVEEVPLVKRYPFDIQFVAHEPKVRTFINKIVADKKQFYIPAAVVIANEQLTGPSKASLTAGAEPAAAPAPTPADPNAPAAPPPVAPSADQAPAIPPPAPSAEAPKFVVGEEKLSVGIRFEVVDFADPAPEKTADKPGKPAK